MKYRIYMLFFSLSILSYSCTINNKEENDTKYNEIVTKHTEIKQIISKEVGDTFYIYIKLPKHYNDSIKRYPVLYLLDGDIDFNMAMSIVRYLQYGKDLPEMIIVAIGYATMLSDNEVNHRERDYTISKSEGFNESGGGKQYLEFLKNELLPLIDSKYRTNDFRVLNGYSLGGLFVINAFIESPELFNGYIAGSPYLAKDEKLLLEKMDLLSGVREKRKIFISVGETEDKTQYHNPINSIYSRLKEENNISILFTEFKNGTHFTCPPEALTYGLQFIFRDTVIVEP